MGLEGASNKTPHKVYLDGFFMDQREVTQIEFVKARGANPSKFSGDNLPADQVTWYEARAYCAKVGKRLPTEAEWEKSVRGGTTTNYYWGDDMDFAYTWLDDNADDRTHPVATKKPNAYGLYDMSGNVWEWVDAYYLPHPGNTIPKPEYGKDKRVLKGGSWFDCLSYGCGLSAPTFNRSFFNPEVKNNSFGFRCAKNP